MNGVQVSSDFEPAESVSGESLIDFLDRALDKADEHNAYLDPFVIVKDGLFCIEIAFPDGPKEFRAPTKRDLYNQLRAVL